jgi:hypothetical protein
MIRILTAETSRPIALVAVVALFPIMLFALMVTPRVVTGSQGQTFDDYVLEFCSSRLRPWRFSAPG